jgi:VWFA-related protein
MGQSKAQVITDPEATLRIYGRAVLVDVVVTDKHGQVVPGLRKEDFAVKENGKPQAIDFFEPHFAAAPGTPEAAPPLPPNTFTNVPAVAPNEAINVLLMDALNTPTTDQAYVRLQMVKYLALMPPGIRAGVFMLSERLRIIQGFTQDSTLLRASIARLAANPSPSPLLGSPAETDAQASLTSMIQEMAANTGSSQLAASAAALQEFLAQQTSFEANQQLLMTLESLQTIARYLNRVPGRKNLIWFVGQFPLCIPGVTSSMGGCPYEDEYRKTMNLLAAARVSVYPIDAGGVMAPNADIGGPTQGHSSGSTFPRGPFAYINSETWAETTGGKAYHGNGLKEELAEAIDNGSRYYTIAYTPADRKEIGRERKIEMRTVDGKYKLAYRHSYFEQTPKELRITEAAPAKDPLRPLMDRGMPSFTELRYRVKVEPSNPQPAPNAPHAGDNPNLNGPLTRYTVRFFLAADGLNLIQGPDGVRRQTIEVALMAYSQEGKPLNWQVRSIWLAIRPDQNALAQSSGIPFHFDFDAPPGDVYLRTGVYDASTSRAGTLEIPLTSITVARK